jgi:secreted trypsin-like serine protease
MTNRRENARRSRTALVTMVVAAVVLTPTLPAAAAAVQGEVPAGRYPFVVQVERDHGEGWQHSCGAALVSERLVVTAAHCLPREGSVDSLRLVFDRVDLTQPAAEVVDSGGIAEIVSLDWQDESVVYHDIGVIVLEQPRPEAPVRLVPEGGPPAAPPGAAAILAGWGREPGGPPTLVLEEAELTVLPTSDCDYDADTPAQEGVCAGDVDSVRSGDSGGPLFVVDDTGTATQVGVVSGGYVERPTSFTDLADHVMWRGLRDAASTPEARELITDAAGLAP